MNDRFITVNFYSQSLDGDTDFKQLVIRCKYIDNLWIEYTKTVDGSKIIESRKSYSVSIDGNKYSMMPKDYKRLRRQLTGGVLTRIWRWLV